MFNSINGTDIIVISSEQFGSDNVRTSELMTGMAQGRRVYFFSKPIIGMTKKPTFFYKKESHKTTVVQPYLPSDLSIESYEKDLIKLMKEFIHDEHISHLTIWTDTVNAAPFIRELKPEVSVYDRAGEFRNMTADITIDSRDSYYSLHNNIEELNFDVKVEAVFLEDAAARPVIQELKSLNRSPHLAISKYQLMVGLDLQSLQS